MTKNALEYLNYLETTKHNRTTETETERSNRAREMENTRSNIARENENIRSNFANEALKRQSNVITDAHYQRQDTEAIRSNMAKELENYRHNVTTEYTANYQALNNAIDVLNHGVSNLISNVNARTGIYNAQTQRMQTLNQQELGWAQLEVSQKQADIQQANVETMKQHYERQDAVSASLLPYQQANYQSQTDWNNSKAAGQNIDNKLKKPQFFIQSQTSLMNAAGSIMGGAGRLVSGAKGVLY